MILSLVLWWITVQVLGLAGLPLTRFLLRHLPDGGYPFAKAAGLLFTGYLAWLVAMIAGVPWGVPLLVIAALGVAALGWFASRGQSLPSIRLRRVLAYELVFLVAFALLLMLRGRYGVDGSNYISPNPWNTERPMDFAFFNAIRRTTTLPPPDPWLSGYSINYYYFGYLLMAVLAMLSNTESGLAYNLALATIFALSAMQIVGLTTSLMLRTRRAVRPVLLMLVGATAVVLVLFAGNQVGMLQNVTGVAGVAGLSGRDLGRAIANGVGARTTLTLEDPYIPWGGSLRTSVEPQDNDIAQRSFSWWWDPSRAVWDRGIDPQDQTKYYAITEFPLFSFLLGDMHPHVTTLPFVLLALALALQIALRDAPPAFTKGWRGWFELALIGVTVGSLYAINSWDFPTYLLLTLGALAVVYIRCADGRPIAWKPFAMQTGLIIVASLVLLVPFHLSFRSPVGGKEALTNIPILATFSRAAGVVTWTKTPLHSFLIIFGTTLVPLLGLLVTRRTPMRWLPWFTLAALLGDLAIGFPLLFLFPLAIWALATALSHTTDRTLAFALGAFALACAISFGTEIIYLRDAFALRMNTIFKFYYQVWVILGVLAPYALWRMWQQEAHTSLPPRSATSAIRARLSLPGGVRNFSALLFLVLLAGALVYPLTILPLTLSQPFTTLSGITPRQNTPAGAAAINWLRENAPAGSVILEGMGDRAYDVSGLGSAGVSASTGLPTVLGWIGHQQQWRAGDTRVMAQLDIRNADVTTIYTTTSVDEARTLLTNYNVRYVYIGDMERQLYPAEGLAKFAGLGTPVFQQDSTVIYQVQ